ncbi:hypothetical protein G3580_02680 [Nitrogeniibacter mangrovi]|uniref:Yip1 domain-containing protein n=1 Tax=Nitrogeniibacter mangrovi TaxID=2016596 RepID=A0A6C1B1C9_9RHOO|nr:hypothetical protein [Nitrogeniibacter mangrovi]QID16628.1 hypothetical protein G3580_02680 [Nitrogeniibacter mangrovi]
MTTHPHDPGATGQDDALRPELLASPAMLWAGGEAWTRVARCEPSLGRTWGRLVMPFAAIAPLMLLFASHTHPQAFGLAPEAHNWEWVAVLLWLAECATVWLMGTMLHVMVPESPARPSREQAFLLAALAAAPLWASAMVLAVPSVAALLVGQLLGQAACLRMLVRGLRALRPGAEALEAVHLAVMVHSAVLVLWVLLFGLFLISTVTP